jgi:hypothetical protein
LQNGRYDDDEDDTNSRGADPKNTSWPFVTIDAFQEKTASTRILSNVLHMSLLPIVTVDQKRAWERYSVANSQWYTDGLAYQEATRTNTNGTRRLVGNETHQDNTTVAGVEDDAFDLFRPYIFEYLDGKPVAGPGPFTPVWQAAPLTFLDGVNVDLLSWDRPGKLISLCMESKEVVFGGFSPSVPGNTSSPYFLTAWYSSLLSTAAGQPVDYKGDPIINGAYPIFSDFSDRRELVAVLMFQFSWQEYFQDILPENSEGFMVVLHNECDGFYTFIIDGGDVQSIGFGDLHDPAFDDMGSATLLADGMVINDGSRGGAKLNLAGCPYALHVYPTAQLRDKYVTDMPVLLTTATAAVFLFTIAMFALYDRLVERRQRVVVQTAKQSTDIVSALFPENVRVRLLENGYGMLAPNQRLKSYLVDGDTRTVESAKPIADLFPNTTVLFADISGFTAWYVSCSERKMLLLGNLIDHLILTAVFLFVGYVHTLKRFAKYIDADSSPFIIRSQASTREPSQVFILLETIYQVSVWSMGLLTLFHRTDRLKQNCM